MPRQIRVLDGAYGMVEDVLYSISDAEDWVRRNQADFSGWAEDVAMGHISVQEMKRRMNAEFANAVKQIQEARGLAASNGRRMGFSHLHESLIAVAPEPVTAGFRIVLPLPQEAS